MRKMMWLLPTISLWTVAPAAQAQFSPLYSPRPTRPYAPGIHGVRDPFGTPMPGIPGIPSAFDPFGLPGIPTARQPWMPPTAQDILRRPQFGDPMPGQRFDPWGNRDPLAHLRGPNPTGGNASNPNFRIDPAIPPVVVPPLPPATIDPKLLDFLKPSLEFKHNEAKAPAHAAGPPPAWLRWEYALGVFLVALIGGLLHALTRSRTSAD